MRETRADTARAIGLALVLHLALFAFMVVGLWWTQSAAPSAAGAISAELIDADDLSAAMRRTLREKPQPVEEEVEPEPLPEPVPEQVEPQPKPQDFIPVPDEVDQVAVTEQPTPTPAVEEKVQEAKQKQEQVDLTEQERQREAQRRERVTAMEQERLKQLEDVRRRRAAAAREADLAEQRLQQLASARAPRATGAQSDATTSGANGTDDDLRARYAAALQAAILAKWTRPDTVPIGATCRLVIRQLPGGNVMGAEVSSPCSYDEQGRRSIEAAVLKAQPLPYAGFEGVFSREVTLNFRAEDR